MNKKLVLNVIFDPQYLTDGYKKVLLDVYKKKFEKKCTNDGYIVNINRIHKINSTLLTNNNQIDMISVCECDIIKPEIDMEVECVIDMIHVNGIFVNMCGIKMLIPNSDEYEYYNEYFVYKNNKYIIGDNIKVKIINVRYDRYMYTCIGNLI